jgi:hypothetical protein
MLRTSPVRLAAPGRVRMAADGAVALPSGRAPKRTATSSTKVESGWPGSGSNLMRLRPHRSNAPAIGFVLLQGELVIRFTQPGSS